MIRDELLNWAKELKLEIDTDWLNRPDTSIHEKKYWEWNTMYERKKDTLRRLNIILEKKYYATEWATISLDQRGNILW